MSLGSEKAAVQNPLIRYAVEVGWTYLSPETALDRRRGITSPVLDSVLVEQLQHLNPGLVDSLRALELTQRIARVRPTIEGNFDAWHYLRGLKTVFIPEHKRERNVRFVDLDNPTRNAFHVTDELLFSNGTPPDIRTDITFFVNGLPVIVVETKAATEREGLVEALDDLRYYHEKGPELLALIQLQAVTHLVDFRYSATWSFSRKGFFQWRDERAVDFETVVKTFTAPLRVLRLLTDYILFVRRDGDLTKTVLRPHQMRAAERCLARARDPSRRRGLIWHTQGSGKTYTMIVVARLLMADPSLGNPTVLLLIDRTELETQLSGVLESVGLGQGTIARSKRHLRRLLTTDRRGLIVSMIHKFDDVPPDVNLSPNIFVLVDEAHRTTGGDLGNYLIGALPNATYLGFTGTPIDRTAYGQGTFKVFGTDDDKGYLDKYSIRESLADGTTVPLNYALAPSDLQVDRETLDREFLNLAELEGVADIQELNQVLEKAVTLRNMLKNPERVEKVARFVAGHFRETVEPMGYKAFLVGVDREACALYKEALDRHLPPEYSRVVISGPEKKDSALLRRHCQTPEREKAVRKAFSRAGGAPKILIVTEKLLTGFDAPILYCLYLDKPMRDHVLLQAIARVNRPHEDEDGRRKPAGFVLDFVGVFGNLEKALAFDSEDVKGVVQDLAVLRERFAAMMAEARRDYLPVGLGLVDDKLVEAVLEFFRDQERRQEFSAFFAAIQDIYEILSPDGFLRPYLADFELLTRMFHTMRSNYERGVPVERSFLRKTARLVQEQTSSGEVAELGPVYELNSGTLERIAAADQPDTVKVFGLLKSLHEHVKRLAGEQPWLISIGDRAEAVALAFEQRLKTAQEALADLMTLVSETGEAAAERAKTDFSRDAFTVLWHLKHQWRRGASPAGAGAARPATDAQPATDARPADATQPEGPGGLPGPDRSEQVARAVDAAFAEHPHWRSGGAQERELRQKLYKALLDAGTNAEDVVDLATGLLRVLRRATS